MLGRRHQTLAAAWLATASVLFYSWWDWHYTVIMLASVAFNYLASCNIAALVAAHRMRRARVALILVIVANLAALGYFKYSNFFIASVNELPGVNITWGNVALPLGISFFTFTQIAFQVDIFEKKAAPTNPMHYLLFVTYFPHLIAGPILHHAEMMPQFKRPGTYRPSAEAISVGVTIFMFGLFKKMIIADSLGIFADRAFLPARAAHIGTLDAWAGALCYTLQIYFDFSAYCDMAIGISRIFNISLPANFESPYRATSIIEFWRRWHMTLSRFLRDYLYIPLGGNRQGRRRRYLNLLTTMALGGLWHGAGWTFVIWGCLHGGYLCVNHAWSATIGNRMTLPTSLSWAITFLAVVVAWVFFRAPDTRTALDLLTAMGGFADGGGAPTTIAGWQAWGSGHTEQLAWIAAGMVIALVAPNMRQIMRGHDLVLAGFTAPNLRLWSRFGLIWQPTLPWAAMSIVAFAVSLRSFGHVSQFLYFQF